MQLLDSYSSANSCEIFYGLGIFGKTRLALAAVPSRRLLCIILMNKLFIILIVASTIIGCGIFDKSYKSEIDGVYIPKNLDEAVAELDKDFPDSLKTEIRKMTEDEFSARYHMGTGMWMRNNWSLWGGSRLSRYFNKLEIYHPDDMSGIILDSFHRSLTNQPIELEKQVEYYKLYWIVSKKPGNKDFPNGEKDLEFDSGMSYDRPDEKPAIVHIQTNSSTAKIWLFDHYLGWKLVNQYQIDELSENQKDRFDILRRIYSE